MSIRRAILYRFHAGVWLLLGAAAAWSAGLDVSLDPGMFADDAALHNNQLSSGLDLSLHNPLFNMAVDYDFQVQVDDSVRATNDDMAQRLGASLKSRALDHLLGVNTHMLADSLYWTSRGAWHHQFSPGFSRRLADVATVDVNYQVLLTKPAAQAVPQEQHGYSVGLRGAVGGGRLHWNGAYSNADIYRDSSLPVQSNETLRLQSSYRVLPQMQVRVSSALTEITRFNAASSASFLQTQFGAGLHWTPSSEYAIDLSFNQTAQSHTGEAILLRQGRLSWNPRDDVKLSLNYGDQLAAGTPGVMLNTKVFLQLF